MLVWFIAINAVYKYGIIESKETIVLGVVFVAACVILIWLYKGHWLLVYLSFMGLAMILWGWMFLDGGPVYEFKEGRNIIAATGYLAVLLSLIPWGSIWIKIRKG